MQQTHIGEIIGQSSKKLSLADLPLYKKKLLEAKGDWIISWVNDGGPYFVESENKVLDQDKLPIVVELFPISTKFSVFKNSELTAHAYSYMSRGCIYSCYFCSESKIVNGKLQNVKTAPLQLVKQFKKIKQVAIERYKTNKVSAFIKDSILFGGQNGLLLEFNNIIEEQKLDIEFGCQFTVDFLLDPKKQKIFSLLAKNGLKYIFWGLETIDKRVAQSMSKNIDTNDWLLKSEQAIAFLQKIDIKCGISLLFGLGESQNSRLKVLDKIKEWQAKYNNPHVISLNWAVLHPLRHTENDQTYVKWGTSLESPYLDFFTKILGEASEKYCMPGTTLASLTELEEIESKYKNVCSIN